jgi:hypothetical protein
VSKLVFTANPGNIPLRTVIEINKLEDDNLDVIVTSAADQAEGPGGRMAPARRTVATSSMVGPSAPSVASRP